MLSENPAKIRETGGTNEIAEFQTMVENAQTDQ